MTEMAVWLDPALPFTVDYLCAALERVRQRAADGLIALPRVGMGVGGLLVGERTAAGIRITGAIELPCSHSLGPTFQLTPDEIRQSMQALKDAGSHRGVVGLYCTRTRGPVALGGPERELFDLLCPEPWQVAFVVRPAPGEVAKAAFFFRQNGTLQAGTSQDLWDWNPPDLEKTQRDVAARLDAISKVLANPPAGVMPMPQSGQIQSHPIHSQPIHSQPIQSHHAPAQATPPPPAAYRPAVEEEDFSFAPPPVTEMPRLEPRSAVQRDSPPPAAPKPVAPQPVAPQPVAPQPASPKPAARPSFITAGLFAQLDEEPAAARPQTAHPNLVTNPRPSSAPAGARAASSPAPRMPAAQAGKRRALWAAIALIVILLGGGGIFLTRDMWMPRPPLAMTSTDSNGDMEIRWNSQATRGIDRGELLINDGGELNTITLDSTKLLAGAYQYKRKSERVTVTLDLGAVRGRTGYQLEPIGALPDPSATPAAAGAPTAPGASAPANNAASPSGGTAPAVAASPASPAASAASASPAASTADASPTPKAAAKKRPHK